MDGVYRFGCQPGHAGVRAALDHLSAHHHESVRLGDVARASGLSSFRLAHLIQEQTGLSMMLHVHRLSARSAQRLLESTTMSCVEVGHTVGFGDRSYLTRQFRLPTGLTPAEHRRAFRGSRPSSGRHAVDVRATTPLV